MTFRMEVLWIGFQFRWSYQSYSTQETNEGQNDFAEPDIASYKSRKGIRETKFHLIS